HAGAINLGQQTPVRLEVVRVIPRTRLERVVGLCGSYLVDDALDGLDQEVEGRFARVGRMCSAPERTDRPRDVDTASCAKLIRQREALHALLECSLALAAIGRQRI